MFEDFKKAIRMPVSAYFRQHQIDVVDEYRKNLGKQENTLDTIFHTEDKQQTTLDVFKMNVPEISKEIDKIEDMQELGTLEYRLRMAHNIVKTKKLKALGKWKQTYK